ncbi:MAG: AmmeMemoRadiSam system radical SAM enzyme, partial [Candidatus Brocadiales bacterium]
VPPTSVKKLDEARRIGMEEGLWFVYTGNVRGHPGENTYCYRCGKTLIERLGFCANTFEIEDGKCKYCKADIHIVGEYGN